jgi:signal transduction histidine kinase
VRRGPSPKGVAFGLAVLQILGTRAVAYGQPGPTLNALGYALLIAGPVALIVRHRFPVVALAGALAAAVAYFVLGFPSGPAFIAAIVGVFTALRMRRRVETWTLVGLAVVADAVIGHMRHTQSIREIILAAGGALIVLMFGEAGRARAKWYTEVARAREEERRRAEEEEERARKEQQRRQASEERLLIARELHDVLGHHLSLINVQAGVGLHLMDDNPEQARAALSAIKHASSEALRETRAVLAALNPRDESAPRAPQPDLSDLDALIAEVTAAGLPVSVSTEGTPRPLPKEVERAAYRIVQEALTNVRRHAGPSATVRIFIAYLTSALEVAISDDGKGKDAESPSAQGTGIAGMRERANALGGTVEAGPRDAGGFEVRAVLPAEGVA